MEYDARYFSNTNAFGTDEYTWEARRKFEEINVSLFRAFCPGVKKVLEFGCGRGFFLKQLHIEGYEKGMGVDISKWCVDNATTEGGIVARLRSDLYPYAALQHVVKSGVYDAVVSIFALEHIEPFHLVKLANTLIRYARKWIMIRVPLADPEGVPETWKWHTAEGGHYTIWTIDQWIQLFEGCQNFCKFRHAYISKDREVLSATIVFFTGAKEDYEHFSYEPYVTTIAGRNEVEME